MQTPKYCHPSNEGSLNYGTFSFYMYIYTYIYICMPKPYTKWNFFPGTPLSSGVWPASWCDLRLLEPQKKCRDIIGSIGMDGDVRICIHGHRPVGTRACSVFIQNVCMHCLSL